jgi:tetratricopeptide (TPR) repeat protein
VTSPSDAASSRPSVELSGQPSELDIDEKTIPSVDLSFLKLSSNYHQLGTEDIPEAFLNSSNQPEQDTALVDLLQDGHFRRAAGAAVVQLFQCPPEDTKRILQLLYTRLACLVLIARPDLAAAEGAALTDFLARNPPGAAELVPFIPWELRLLLVRLQSITAADSGRRGVMSLYSLAGEVRSHIRDATDAGNEARISMWSDRLADLGLRVADTLVEMGELETATRHLDSLVGVDGDELAYRKALLRLRVGDVGGAQVSVSRIQDPTRKLALDALLDIANGEVSAAVDKWQSRENEDNNALFASNLAVGLLYTGRIAQARQVFEELVQNVPTFPGLLFNLGTVYELCTEQALQRKTEIIDIVASKQPNPIAGGWEKPNFDFKL